MTDPNEKNATDLLNDYDGIPFGDEDDMDGFDDTEFAPDNENSDIQSISENPDRTPPNTPNGEPTKHGGIEPKAGFDPTGL